MTKRSRDTGFVAASVAVHVGAFVMLLGVRVPPTADKKTLVVEIRHTERAAPAPSPVEPQRAPTPTPEVPSRWPKRVAPKDRVAPPPVAPARPAPPSAPAGASSPALAPPASAPPTSAPPTAAPSHPINLFATSAITVAVPSLSSSSAAARDPGGVSHRAGDGTLQAGQRDSAADKEEASARLHDFFAISEGQERVRTGRVAPRWRDAERQAVSTFQPPESIVSDDSSPAALIKQWLLGGPPQSSPTARGDDPSVSGFNGGGVNGAIAPDPRDLDKARTEVEVVVAADGTILSARIKVSSHRKKFDQAALKAVREAIDGKGKLEEGKEMVTVWAVEAWLRVAPLSPMGGFSFDESSGSISAGSYPMKKSVKTRVALLSIAPR